MIRATVQSATHLDSLSSASGVVYANSTYYVVGDDNPWLYRLNENLESAQWIRLSVTDSLVDGRTPKSLKADFECMEKLIIDGHEYLIFLSSGSMEITRDTADIVDILTGKLVKKRNIRPLFQRIKETAGITGEDEINIEGLAITREMVYLFHRGNISGNLVIAINTRHFYNYLTESGSSVPEFGLLPFSLPAYEGTTAGFSGACATPDEKYLVFTASMEKTVDVYHDGTITGSYIGLIPLDEISAGTFYATLMKKDGEILPKKLEGVAVHDVTGNIAHLLVVADNDDGTSDLYEVELLLPEK
ncbi:MAG: hypothetical protein P8100_08650 [bacterium]